MIFCAQECFFMEGLGFAPQGAKQNQDAPGLPTVSFGQKRFFPQGQRRTPQRPDAGEHPAFVAFIGG